MNKVRNTNRHFGRGYKYFISDPETFVLPKIERLSILNLLSESVFAKKLSNSLFIEDYYEIFRNKTVMKIMEAIKSRRKVKLDYNLIHLPENRFRLLNVAPYQLHYICSNWYLLGQEDVFGLMRIPLFFLFDAIVSNESYIFPDNYSSEKLGYYLYGKTNERITVSVKIQDLHPESLSLVKYPLMPFQYEVEYGFVDKNEAIASLNKYNVKIVFNLPKTPFALQMLESKLGPYAYTILDETNPFSLFTEEQYNNERCYPVML